MQMSEFRLRRIFLPRTWLNKGKKKINAAAQAIDSSTTFARPRRHHSTWLASSKRYDKRYKDRFLDQEKSIYRKSTYQEGARCMLVFTNPTADFSAGCALPITARGFLVTHPITLPFANGTVPAPVSGGSHHSASLFTAPIS
jgi:hypothetical protein